MSKDASSTVTKPNQLRLQKQMEDIMKTHTNHANHAAHTDHTQGQHCHRQTPEESHRRLAVKATLHCLLGCGIGEVAGVILGTGLGLGMWQSMALGVTLGFAFGFGLGMIPLLRGGMAPASALRIILVSEGISIAVMEAAEALVQIYTPGVMQAGLLDSLFWAGMMISLGAGFAAALPVNIILVRNGIRHQH